ncbi:helix-turn-helix domain-containing protein [Limosilactobacillus mucosae]|jgi:excisionase family DNA binding protein|uniref:helix-turn-helix domain-containing protein n=1 Tax=Limosilactobacillus mucosae TaxID=97478 RepID=UPI0006528596|nr:helix-turn-helix domain-containing protein [Limosilactobacillus mucosae]
MQEQEYMSLTDAAKYLGYGSKHVVYDLIKAGMPVIKVGKTMRVSKTAIDSFMKAHEEVVTNEK